MTSVRSNNMNLRGFKTWIRKGLRGFKTWIRKGLREFKTWIRKSEFVAMTQRPLNILDKESMKSTSKWFFCHDILNLQIISQKKD